MWWAFIIEVDLLRWFKLEFDWIEVLKNNVYIQEQILISIFFSWWILLSYISIFKALIFLFPDFFLISLIAWSRLMVKLFVWIENVKLVVFPSSCIIWPLTPKKTHLSFLFMFSFFKSNFALQLMDNVRQLHVE